MAFKRQDQQLRRSVYQGAFARLRKLYDALQPQITYQAIQPELEELQSWWYSNSLSLDQATNETLVGVVNIVRLNLLPTPKAEYLLLISRVPEAFDLAKDSIRCVLNQPRRG